MTMNGLTMLVLVLVPAITWMLMRVRDNARDKKPEIIAQNQAKEAEFSALLQEGETIHAICQTSKWHSAVTQRALITEDKTGVHRIAFDQIKKIRFSDIRGRKTRAVDRVMTVELMDADGNEYSLFKYSEKFFELVGMLMERAG
ncbi:MAG: hypothetical protein Q4B19_01880 [Clostridia bacterium]|nr:hypothetical protein [Clostridia bacterium]